MSLSRSLVLLILTPALGCQAELGDDGQSVSSDSVPIAGSTRNVTFGINADYYDRFVAAVPGAHGERAYGAKPTPADPDGVVPDSWPTSSGVTTMFTLYLRHDALLSGKFDKQLLSFFATAPEDSYVTLWQEVGALDHSEYGIYASNIASMNSYMQRLIHDNRDNRGTNQAKHIKFGPVVIGIGAIDQVGDKEWVKLKDLMEGGPYDFYGLDVYDTDRGALRNNAGFISQAKIDEKMGFFRKIAQELSRRSNPEIAIGEVNSPKVNNRPGLFTFIGEWMNGHHGTLMLTHYYFNGPVSGPWLPCEAGDQSGCPTIRALKSLQDRYGN
jgi:hypothetical protein